MLVDILIKDRPIRKYFDAEQNCFVEGRRGSAYTIQLSNPCAFKVKAVVSVDGINILTGDQVWEQGYVLAAKQKLNISGWRIDKNKAAQFVFADLKDSYGSGQGNMGVIGVMTFSERVVASVSSTWSGMETIVPWGTTGVVYGATPTADIGSSLRSTAISVNNVASLAVPTNSLGTGWGEEVTQKTAADYTVFNPDPYETTVVYYDSAKGLERRGIYVGGNTNPNPFPGSQYVTATTDFGCKPPKTTRRRR
jgi:hypothetical protein